MIVVEDATYSPGEMHERGLARLRDAGARLTHCKALAYEWVRTVERSTRAAELRRARAGAVPALSEGRRGATEQVALAAADRAARRRAGIAQERELRVGLDPLGDHGRVRARGVGDHGLQHAERGRVVRGVGDHGAVDLDEVDRRAAQQLEAGVARADVVERDLEAQLPQPRDLAHDVPQPRRRVLGELEHELVRLEADRAHGVDQGRAGEHVALERLRRDVEEQQRVGGQVGRQPQRAAPGDRVEQMRVAEPLGQVEELAGAAEAEARVGSRERLVAEDGVALEVPDRLEGDVELAVLEQLAQAADAVRMGQRRARGDLVEDDDRAADRPLGLVDRGVGLLAQQGEVPRGRRRARRCPR